MTRWTRCLLVLAATAGHALACHAQSQVEAPGLTARVGAPSAASGSPASRAFMAPNAPARRVHLKAGHSRQSFGFVASAGEALTLMVQDSHAASACDVGLVVEDAAGRAVARQRCAAHAGQRLDFSVPAAGIYSARFTAREGADSALDVALQSPVRMPGQAAMLQGCDTMALPLDKSVSGAWDSGCESVSYAGHYARYYSITVPQTQVITVSLGSGVNPSLVLHDGSTPQGIVIAADSDRGPEDDAQVVMLLAAGTYTVEATTERAARAGAFKVAARRNVAPCFSAIKFNSPVQGKWGRVCASQYEDDRYAKYYTFTVPSRRMVTLALRPAEPTIARLILRNGATQLGAVVNVTSSNTPGNNAAVTLSLEAGTYSVEASSLYPAHVGEFTLSVVTAASCTDTLALDTVVEGTLTDACFSTYYPGSFARFYTFTVPSEQVVTITLVPPPGATAGGRTLVLRSGAGPLGEVIRSDQYDSYSGFASVRQRFSPGTYTVEVANGGQGLVQYSLAARTNVAPCFLDLAFNTPLAGRLQPICPASGEQPYQYGNFYPLHVAVAGTYGFEVKSSLPLAKVEVIRGTDQLGWTETSVRYVGGYTKLIADLTPGDYLLQVLNSDGSGQQPGDYTLTAVANQPSCVAPLKLGSSSSGLLASDCQSQTLTGSYARYYSVEVKSPQVVTAIATSARDAYLVLHAGSDPYGPLVEQDDNSGIGLDPMITRYLTPGTYTYEVTTTKAGQSGEFNLAVRGNTAPCTAPIAPGQSVQGAWADACVSPTLDDRYAKFHTFSLDGTRTVTIQLSSATDAYLVLRGGPYQQIGTLLATDDNSGGGTDARISMTLPSGTYTIEATTGRTLQQGAYTLQLN